MIKKTTGGNSIISLISLEVGFVDITIAEVGSRLVVPIDTGCVAGLGHTALANFSSSILSRFNALSALCCRMRSRDAA